MKCVICLSTGECQIITFEEFLKFIPNTIIENNAHFYAVEKLTEQMNAISGVTELQYGINSRIIELKKVCVKNQFSTFLMKKKLFSLSNETKIVTMNDLSDMNYKLLEWGTNDCLLFPFEISKYQKFYIMCDNEAAFKLFENNKGIALQEMDPNKWIVCQVNEFSDFSNELGNYMRYEVSSQNLLQKGIVNPIDFGFKPMMDRDPYTLSSKYSHIIKNWNI